ncbi:MAG TPA: CPBP family intramembrane glutamic endopeptidase [Anaerolineae bacterium]|nr:CPBP family intramembrane glutamic endopeptidase [Anaerolineae bacterium]
MDDNRSLSAGPNWKQVVTYLAITFGLTYLLNLILYLNVGSFTEITSDLAAPLQVLLQLQMLIPATVAIVLQLFIFRTSPIFRERSPLRWFLYAYLAYAGIFVLLAVGLFFIHSQIYLTAISLITLGLSVAILALIILLRLIAGRESLARAGLHGGPIRYYFTFGLGLILVYLAMTGLNALFGLGQAANFMDLLGAAGEAPGLDQVPPSLLFALIAFQTVILGPILGLTLGFGEEYGWRGFLQTELIKLGRVRGLLLLGVIWGLWHAPIIVMGYNYPGYPVLGPVVMTLYTIVLAFFFGYAVLKSGSVWLAAFLHALNNQVVAFLMLAVYTPADPILSFGIGIYGVLVWAVVIVALMILDRDTWTGAAATAPAALPSEEEIL